ncbi:SpoIIIAH-like family protein [Rossellomorea sp. BNER]|uniref:SpoIIIAH-like family protein n=1 Tax=Rossellomorea sp. BNER TaxID=2962031 RepID=UPI003AF22302|nr:SpoIIIAH-like family protein [Rossellomorea sp. BNER]
MLLKKQTVWLLTMLSLVIVLSVYYITSPAQQGTDTAAVEEEKDTGKQEEAAKGEEGKETMSESEMDIVTGAAGDEEFEAMRLEVKDERSKAREQLEVKLSSTDLSPEERNKAYEEMETLQELATTEVALETMIKTLGYEDALVMADADKVKVTVKAEKHDAASANKIIQLVKSEIGQLKHVAVNFQAVE